MKKRSVVYLIVGIFILVIGASVWYMFRYRSCLKHIFYVPPREQSEIGGGYSGLEPIADKGDYYHFNFQEFRASDEAMRACIWK